MQNTNVKNNALYHKLRYNVKCSDLIDKFISIAKELNYPIFKSNKAYPINLNIWGIRSKNSSTKYYNDVIVVFYNEPNDEFDDWNVRIYEATTDPSDINLKKPVSYKGCAILPEGCHKGLWKIGKHKNQYQALVQANNCQVIRDRDYDDILDFDNTFDYGMFGINCHRASSTKIQDEIGHYSAGCQVFKDVNLFTKEFMPLCKKAIGSGTQSYILINELDLDL